MFGFLKKKRVDPHAQLRAALGDHALPSFPGIVMEVLRELRDPGGSAASVARIVAADPALTVKLLKLANTGAGAVRRIDSVQQAIALAGMASVESLVLAVGVREALPTSDAPGFESRRFWRASARRAATASSFARVLHPATAMQSFTASLLQDMAVPLLAHNRPGEYGPILEAWHNREAELDHLENEQFGWHHGEVATWLCDEWGLPERLAEVIGEHHGERGAAPPAVHLVSHIRETDEHPEIDALVAAAERAGLSADRTVGLVTEAWNEADSLAELFAA